MSDLHEVQPGNLCFIRSSAWNAGDDTASTTRVLRLTPKQIVVEGHREGQERRFWRKDLTEVGSVSNYPTGLAGVGAGTVSLVPPSHPDYAQVKAARTDRIRKVRITRALEAALKDLESGAAVDDALLALKGWQEHMTARGDA